MASYQQRLSRHRIARKTCLFGNASRTGSTLTSPRVTAARRNPVQVVPLIRSLEYTTELCWYWPSSGEGLRYRGRYRHHCGNLRCHHRTFGLGRGRQAHRRGNKIIQRQPCSSAARCGKLDRALQCRSFGCRRLRSNLPQNRPPQYAGVENRSGRGAGLHLHPDRSFQSLGLLP